MQGETALRAVLDHVWSSRPKVGLHLGRAGLRPIQSTMFLGIELMARLDPERSEAEAVFDMMETIARLIEDIAPTLFRS